MKFYVLEPHVDGTTHYDPTGVTGKDTREGDENELRHLVDLKVLGTEAPKKAPAKKAD